MLELQSEYYVSRSTLPLLLSQTSTDLSIRTVIFLSEPSRVKNYTKVTIAAARMFAFLTQSIGATP